MGRASRWWDRSARFSCIAHDNFSSSPKANRATRSTAAWLANLTLNLWTWNMSIPRVIRRAPVPAPPATHNWFCRPPAALRGGRDHERFADRAVAGFIRTAARACEARLSPSVKLSSVRCAPKRSPSYLISGLTCADGISPHCAGQSRDRLAIAIHPSVIEPGLRSV